MNSSDFMNNIKYYGKYIAIIIMIFLLLKFIMNLKIYESILLALIITVSILLIENIIYINNIALDPLNCDQCKISTIENKTSSENASSSDSSLLNINNIVPNSDNVNILEIVPETKETFVSNIDEKILNNKINDDNKNILGTDSSHVGELENFITEQQNKNSNMFNKLNSNQNVQENIKLENKLENKEMLIKESLEYPYLAKAKLLNKLTESTEPESNKQELIKDKKYNLDDPITYDVGYVEYQSDGLQKQENDLSFKNKMFKMEIGEPDVVKPFINDGSDYYNKIYSYSSKAPTPSQSLNSELRYGDYNYISPLNKGMTNSSYTFISPNNWYPVPPHPRVCVTNKNCITQPIQISDGKDYMAWATLEDFDKSRRFTGNMGINIDYIKNVLNNDEGY